MKQVMSNYEKQVDIGKSYFLKYDQQLLEEKFHLETDEQYLYLTYIGTRCRIARSTGTIYEKTGGEYTECRSYETVMTIYDMLCHGDGKELPPLSGKWTLVANFAAAGASPSADVSSQKYADYFAGKTEVLKQADVTAQLPAFPFFPVLLQFWDADDEFPPQIKIMWDDQTMRYLNFETTYYLQGDLLARLKAIAEK